MKKKLFVMMAMIMILSVGSIPALATPAGNAQGDWFYHPRLDELELVKLVGDNTFFRTVEDSRWNGTFQGSEDCKATEEDNCAASVDVGTVIFHASGRANFLGWVHFESVYVDGTSGSLEMQVNGTKPDAVNDWVGHWVITGGTLHDDGLRGQGSWWGPGWQEVPGVWGIIHYSGNIHFEAD